MKRIHYAIILAEILSYSLIVTFIFADTFYDLTGALRAGGSGLSPEMAIVAGCLVAIVGSINVWLTIYYMQKAHTMRDWIVLCAWTHRVKFGGRWIKLEDFLVEQLGCQISHGMSADAFKKLSTELDTRWRDIKPELPTPERAPSHNDLAGGPAPAPQH